MRRDIAGSRRQPGRAAAAAAALAVVLAGGLAGCGSAGHGAASGTSSAASAAASQPRPASAGKSRNPLDSSYLKVLTTLGAARLCAVISPVQARQILGTDVAAPAYGRAAGLGVYCRWLKRAAPLSTTDNLYVGISAVIDWADAQQVDKLISARPTTIDGHPALAGGPQRAMTWAQVDVALAGAHDPVAEFRAPTMAMARALATAATPHILAMG
jgi:Protein of unknown function (DUF3558)